ncbi:MAG: ABC transporter permease [Bacillota bacterium]
MIEFLVNNWQQALVLTGEHLFIVLLATSIAAVLGIPLGILISAKEDFAPVVINIANIIMTIPSIALFGIMLPILSVFNLGLGTTPVVIALILYSQLPIIRNTYAAIQNIDPAVVDAAKGIGLSPWQRLIELELPLALPVIIAGLRIAIVMNIGIVTIAVYVGAGGLGKFIQRGIDQVYEEQILVGALLVALLAIVIEVLLYGLEYFVTPEGLREEQQYD